MVVVVDGGGGGGWSKKKFFNFAETLHTDSSKQINLPVLGKFDVLFAKSEKNPIPSFFSKKNYFGFLFIFFLQGNSL